MNLAAPVRSGAWTADPGFGVYVHIPFCRHRCGYCDFNTYAGMDALHESYVEALIASIERAAPDGRPATSVFFGGGTPTLLSPSALGRILEAVRSRIGIAPGAEVTAEANPETVDERSFEALLAAGFNRFSIGAQSLAPHVLAGLERTHTPEAPLDALRAARSAGADDVNLDLIYGSPWETPDDWAGTLEGIVDAGPDHISAYALTVEEGTPLATLVASGRVPNVDPDVQAARYEVGEALLGSAGYERYEVSNWSRPGRASRHNVLYWCAGDYLGFGAGAHGHVAGRRSWAVRLPRDFIAAVNEDRTTEAGAEELTADQRAGEALMLGLRLTSGIDLVGFAELFGHGALDERAGELASLQASGLIETSENRLRIVPNVTFVADEVLRRLI